MTSVLATFQTQPDGFEPPRPITEPPWAEEPSEVFAEIGVFEPPVIEPSAETTRMSTVANPRATSELIAQEQKRAPTLEEELEGIVAAALPSVQDDSMHQASAAMIQDFAIELSAPADEATYSADFTAEAATSSGATLGTEPISTQEFAVDVSLDQGAWKAFGDDDLDDSTSAGIAPMEFPLPAIELPPIIAPNTLEERASTHLQDSSSYAALQSEQLIQYELSEHDSWDDVVASPFEDQEIDIEDIDEEIEELDDFDIVDDDVNIDIDFNV